MPAKAKTKIISAPERVFELKNKLEDFDYMGQNAMVNMHWTSDQFWDAEYFGFVTLLNAKNPKDRPIDPAIMWKQYQEKG
ncbi:hypothetical protein [Lacticaseibacillus paracasei]|uniref:hypothetical protein n=1 Tax=Lacticaseibacillus paracasei TaxID=1597 RepID=UPI0034E3D11E